MEQTVVVKTEMQSNGEILLFYVDENGGNEEGVLTTVQNIENQAIELQQDSSFILSEDASAVLSGDINVPQSSLLNDNWTEDDIKRLLMFYDDNKQIFISGTTQKKHLWTVACKTMLIGKHPNSCETQLNMLRKRYFDYMESHIQKGVYVEWPYFEMCHQVFHNETDRATAVYQVPIEPQVANVPVSKSYNDNVMVVKKVNSRSSGDEKVELMLNLYLKYKKNFQQEYRRKGLWETIAMELGEDDGEYWQKRFLNYKQHYLRLLDKRQLNGPETINWPYMELFDKIYEDDEDFNRKYINQEYRAIVKEVVPEEPRLEWDTTEITVLVKYYFDCFDEFEDRTIPNSFLWNEIGRLLDKTPDTCKQKYEEMKNEHLDKYIEGGYDLRSRKPIAILYDNIISKEIELQMNKIKDRPEQLSVWKTEEIDELVQFFYENIEMYKDTICHYVCWAAIVKKLKRDLQNCKGQWEDLIALYKTILNDKKENSDMQIDWRYIELFDRIFDYGMDNNLLIGYDKLKSPQESGKIGVKKVKIKNEDFTEDFSDDEESFDERGFTKRTKRRSGESKAFKILEYYQKNKDKFSTTNRNKHSLWEVLAKQIGISASQCAHRFRNLKQVYMTYVQREINKPEMPILWPYYALCKKVFGYRAIKNKLKNGKLDSDDSEDWSAKEIKQLINYFSQNFHEINNNVDDGSKWSDLSSEIAKSETSCKEKFLELRKSYRKLKTMRSRNPDVKISWKYFNMFEQIYEAKENNAEEAMNVDDDLMDYIEMSAGTNFKNEQEDEEYQCIIVLPEGEDIENAQIIIQEPTLKQEEQEEEPKTTEPIEQTIEQKTPIKWTKRCKKLLLIHYINYIRSRKGKEINSPDMWKEISSKLQNKSAISCKKMFRRMKINHRHIADDNSDVKKPPCYGLLEKIMRLKPKFVKNKQNEISKDVKDVVLSDEKVMQALKYYLNHIDDFISPRFEKKYLWMELGNHVSEPVNKVFNKINYLKQFYNSETEEVAGQKTPFADLLKEILAKEIAIKLILEVSMPVIDDSVEETWTDEEVEKLLEWYLSNLEKFKNPKFVRSYLWLEVSAILKKSALNCSKKMSEIRTQYRNMVRETPDELPGWRFLELCQKIYGTGKKVNQPANEAVIHGQTDAVP